VTTDANGPRHTDGLLTASHPTAVNLPSSFPDTTAALSYVLPEHVYMDKLVRIMSTNLLHEFANKFRTTKITINISGHTHAIRDRTRYFPVGKIKLQYL
jgi:hypothetical protein